MKLSNHFKCCCISLLLFCSKPIFAQSKQSLSDTIKCLVDDSYKHIKRLKEPDLAVDKLNRAEQLALRTKKPLDLLRVYRYKALLCHFNSDWEGCKKYISKIKELLPACKNPIEIATTYELFFVVSPMPSAQGKAYIDKALQLLRKYGKPKNLIDVNYNLTLYYNKTQEWQKSIEHALLGIQAIKKSGHKTEIAKYLYLYLVDAYTFTDDYKAATNVLQHLDSIRKNQANKNHSFFDYLYYKKIVALYTQLKQYKKATEASMLAFGSIDTIRAKEAKRLHSVYRIKHKLDIKQEEIKRVEIENRLKKTQIKIGLVVIFFITTLLIFLIVFAIYLKKNAKKVQIINRTLEKQNADLGMMTQKLEAALKTKTEFLNVMTHELFTPINGIAIIAHNLKTETDKDCFTQNLDLLDFSSNYLYRLLKNIVDTKSIDNQKDLILNVDAVRLKSLIKKVAQTATIFFKTSTNTFRYRIDSDIPDPLLIDSVKISQILINLLNNADKFTSKGRITLDIALELETETHVKVAFQVSDTGIGIDSEFLDHIFDKFQYGSSEIKEKYGGSGIGLYIVKHFVLLHDSNITVNSEKGEGTTFSFSIWFEKVYKSSTKNMVSNQTAGAVLLVDDNKVNLTLTKRLLESENYKCDITENGFEAIEILKTQRYDLILMDIMMPGINGFETTQKIREANIKTPVVALTAVDISQNQEDFDRANFAGVISKPFIPTDFFEIVKKAVQKHL